MIRVANGTVDNVRHPEVLAPDVHWLDREGPETLALASTGQIAVRQ